MRRLTLAGKDFSDLSAWLLERDRPFCFVARGSSMAPFIRDGDLLVVTPARSWTVKQGDVVLYRSLQGRPVVHRLVRRSPGAGFDAWLVRGDAAGSSAEEVPAFEIIGRVTRAGGGYLRLLRALRALKIRA
jgi:phage repressor protein C with HTH and peptisase S24 domain